MLNYQMVNPIKAHQITIKVPSSESSQHICRQTLSPKHQAFEESPAIDQGVAAPFPRGLLAEQRDEVRQRVAVDLKPGEIPVVQTWQAGESTQKWRIQHVLIWFSMY
jgi:hypothetical protein